MKYLFTICGAVLCLASIAIFMSFPDTTSEVPVIYWVTDANPARGEQVDLFHQWMIDQGHTTAEGKPMVELRLDSANSQPAKKIIQGVSGVGGDIMDMHDMHYFVEIGLLEDVTDWADELGFSTDQTYAAIEPALTSGGKQYAFPCNVYARLMWVNRATFLRYGIEPPSGRWTIEEFAAKGRELDRAANPPGERKTVFITPQVDGKLLYWSMGLSQYNETLTRCTLDDPRFVRALELQKEWTSGPDRFLPTRAERDSFDTGSGYAGPVLQLFNSGNYGTFYMGRFALIQLRKFGNLDLGVVEPPNGGFPVTVTGTRCAAIYVGGDNKDLAKYFLAFLASESYNRQIVMDADALPPNPAYTKLDVFRAPPQFPNEAGVHEPFADAMEEIAVPLVHSEFVLRNVATRLIGNAQSGYLDSNRLTAEEAAREAAERVNAEIDRTLQENPKLQELYDKRLAQQAEIERLRAAGEPVPLELIANPFHRHYYKHQGWSTN